MRLRICVTSGSPKTGNPSKPRIRRPLSRPTSKPQQQTGQPAGQQSDPPSNQQAADQQQDGIDTGVPVALKLIDEKDFDHTGKIDFVDNAISTSSGTIRGRAIFANPNGIFVPGMFGRIRVPGSPPHLALLIPDAAIGSEQARKYVLVVDDSGTVRQKYVTLGQLDGGLRVIKRRLAPHRPRDRQRPDACAARASK